MSNKPSFTEIMQAEGIAGFNKLTCNDIERLVQEGKIQSAYSHVQNLDEFERLRWGPFCDIETGSQYSGLFGKGILSLEHDSLGELLQTINFYGCGETVEFSLEGVEMERHECNATLNFMKKRFGINPEQQQPFYLNGTKPEELADLVQRWHEAQGKRKRWNPSYAKPLQQQKITDLATGSPERWLDQLSFPYKSQKNEDLTISSPKRSSNQFSLPFVEDHYAYDDSPDDYNDYQNYTIDFWNGQREEKLRNVFLPFDGWTLAECFRCGYEAK